MIEYDSATLAEIDDNVDLLEYVKNEIDLRQRGNLWFGSCPLHSDSTPSFAVYPDNHYFCFSCGRSGGIISFLKDYEGLSFREAVDKASVLANVDISKMCVSQTFLFNKQIKKSHRCKEPHKHEILDWSIYEQYRKSPIKEWQAEGIKQEVMDLFQIRYDDKSNRIVYPVLQSNGDLIGVKGRTLWGDYKRLGICKYMNYYPIGVMDFFQGANVTLPYIKKSGEVKVFESIKSVMKMYGNGIKDCVSAEKHTLTPEQRLWLIRQRVDVVLCWDSDVDYRSPDVKRDLDCLKRFTNVYVIDDKKHLLGGQENKNSPIDCGFEVWKELYANRRKIK